MIVSRELARLQLFLERGLGFGFVLAREGLFFLRLDLLGGAGFSESFVLVASVPLGDSGPKPKNAPGKDRDLIFFEVAGFCKRFLARCWLRLRPDFLRRDRRSEAMGFDLSASNQSLPGQTTGNLYPSISSKGSRW